MSKRSIVMVALGLALLGSVALAQSEGWGTGYQMGTSYAGVSGADGTRLTFYCGDAAAARANPAITSGPYLIAVLPKTQLGTSCRRRSRSWLTARRRACLSRPRLVSTRLS